MRQPFSETDEDRTNQVEDFLKKEMPQIQMHGGEANVYFAEAESETVYVELSGKCSECGLSPMTVNLLERRIPEAFNSISTVEVSV